MSAYRCYYHPKDEAGTMCRGCKLPLCTGCHAGVGFCPECAKKRAVVDDLRQMRNGVPPVGATTSKLPPLSSALSPSRSLPPARPRRAPSRPFSQKRGLTGRFRKEIEPQPRRYNHDAVAYRPPVPLVQPRGKARPAEIARAGEPTTWVTPFLAGLGLGALTVLVLVLLVLVVREKPYQKLQERILKPQHVSIEHVVATRDVPTPSEQA